MDFPKSKQKIRVIFAGTAAFGAPLLKALAKDDRYHIPLVITSPNRPAGRKLRPLPSPIKQTAKNLKLAVAEPLTINEDAVVGKIRELAPDVLLVVAYGQLLKKPLLKLPKHGALNVHGSLLPKYRGASPIQQTLLKGDRETGISLMQMQEAMDAGPVFAKIKIGIDPCDHQESLTLKLSLLSAEKIPDLLEKIVKEELIAEAQNEAEASTCQKITKEAGQTDWQKPADTLFNELRAYHGWPGTFTFWQGKRLKIIWAKPLIDEEYKGTPGTVVLTKAGAAVSTGRGLLALEDVQLEGKKASPIQEFIKGHPELIESVLKNQP